MDDNEPNAADLEIDEYLEDEMDDNEPNAADLEIDEYNEAHDSMRRRMCIEKARELVKLKPVYIDTETTGIDDMAEIVSLAVVEHDGRPIIDTLIRPSLYATLPHHIPAEATAIHGITDAMVKYSPTFAEVLPNLLHITWGRCVVIYNAEFDTNMFAQSLHCGYRVWEAVWKAELPPRRVECAMKLYAWYHGEYSDYYNSWRWQKLSAAAKQCGLTFRGAAHGALADADMTRQIIEYMARQA